MIHLNKTYAAICKKQRRTILVSCGIVIIISLTFSCQEFIEVNPPNTQIVGATVFTNDQTATSALVGIYSQMITYGFASGDFTSVTYLGGLSSDELINISPNTTQAEFFNNSLTPSNLVVKEYLWAKAYKNIFTANAILEGLQYSEGITMATKKQLEGEARFIRAFCYFYLVNLFGDVPLLISTDYQENSKASRSSKLQVYQKITSDLIEAQNLLGDEYVTNERVRPNKWAATALLSRTYLYSSDWANAEAQASAVISNSSIYNLVDDLDGVFLANSTEAIWQLMPVQPSINTWEGNSFILTGAPTEVSLNNSILDSFEQGDNRLTKWIDSITVGSDVYHFPYKYKVKASSTLSEYSMILRIAEQYLIRAEARAQQNKTNEAIEDLNAIRKRAGLPELIGPLTQLELMSAIEKERRIELFTEWGHRWFDLKRTNRADQVLASIKLDWEPTDVLYPIPQSEIKINSNLNPQNSGY